MTLNYFDDKYTYSFNFIICSIIYSFFISKYDGEICVKYLKLLESKERELYSINDENIIYIFVKFLNNRNEEESNYLLNKIFENSLIEINQKIISRTLYFSHYLYSYEIFKYESFVKYKSFYKNIRILKKHNWKLHKKLIKEGVNPNEIAKIIRNDEIEKLQEISSQTNFDFNQRIEPSLYERCSIINKEDVSLIDYAAFFSAVKCFKYLLMNGANVEKTGKYAIAGGNEEIIHLCEQNHSLLACAYETAIEFHQNEIFKYIYENKLRKIYSLEELGTKCILSHNYEILSFLQNEGMQICDLHIIASIETGNLYLIQYLLEQYVIDTYIPRISTISWNKELFNYLVTKNYINIKNKNISLYYLIF